MKKDYTVSPFGWHSVLNSPCRAIVLGKASKAGKSKEQYAIVWRLRDGSWRYSCSPQIWANRKKHFEGGERSRKFAVEAVMDGLAENFMERVNIFYSKT